MKKRKGLTLLEVIVSMALISMVVLIFLTIFNTGNKNIFQSGKRTDDTLEIQGVIDRFIENPSSSKVKLLENSKNLGEDNIKIETASIKIKEISENYVDGKIITIEDNGIKITTFVPFEEKEELNEK